MSKKAVQSTKAQVESARQVSKALNEWGFKSDVDETGFGQFLFGFFIPDEDGFSIGIQFVVNTPFSILSEVTRALIDVDEWFIADSPVYATERNGKLEHFTCCGAYVEYAKDLLERPEPHKH